MAAQRGHETCHNCTGRERGRIWTHILWPQTLKQPLPPTTTITILVRGQKQLTCLAISLIFIGFPLQISRGIVPCALPCLSISWEADSPSEPGGRLILTKIRARMNPPLAALLQAKEANIQNGHADRLERGLPIRKPMWLRISGQTSKTLRRASAAILWLGSQKQIRICRKAVRDDKYVKQRRYKMGEMLEPQSTW